METLEELKAIIAEKPKGAECFCMVDDLNIVMYINSDGAGYDESDNNWYDLGSIASLNRFRSLSDIEGIIELREQVKSGYEAYTRIEAIKQRYNGENKYKTNLLIDAEMLLRSEDKEKRDNLADIIKEVLK